MSVTTSWLVNLLLRSGKSLGIDLCFAFLECSGYTRVMERLEAAIRRITRKPLESIGLLMAVSLVLVGLYVLSPWYVGVVVPITSVKIVVGIFYVLMGLPFLVKGFHAIPKWVANLSSNCIFVGYFFTTLLIFITVGPTPVYWVWPLVGTLIALVVHVWVVRRL